MRRVPRALAAGFALAFITVVSSSVGVSAQNPGGSPEARKVKNPVAATPQSIVAGKAAFMKNCRFCHGEDAKGDGKMAPKDTHPANLVDDKWDRGSTDGEIFAVIRNGAGPKFDMKPNKALSDQDIWNIINYLRSIGPQKARSTGAQKSSTDAQKKR
jgi:mono/diheme cytochrome c family protein